jgi:hypothetical protein
MGDVAVRSESGQLAQMQATLDALAARVAANETRARWSWRRLGVLLAAVALVTGLVEVR